MDTSSQSDRKQSLMGQILSKENLNTAYLQVVRNKGVDGGVRNLGVPTVTDRFVQQAIITALDMMKNGNIRIVDIDLEKFF